MPSRVAWITTNVSGPSGAGGECFPAHRCGDNVSSARIDGHQSAHRSPLSLCSSSEIGSLLPVGCLTVDPCGDSPTTAGKISTTGTPQRRVGATVAHPARPRTPTVHAFLRHLEAEGFEAAPRVIGSASTTPATIFAESVWPNPQQSLHEAGAMLRRLHEVSRRFTPPPGAHWTPWSLNARDDEAVISHSNIGALAWGVPPPALYRQVVS